MRKTPLFPVFVLVACSQSAVPGANAPPALDVRAAVERAMGGLSPAANPDAVARFSLSLPRFADEAVTARAASDALTLLPRGARHVAFREERGTTIAHDVMWHVDALWSAEPTRAELYYVLRDAEAPRSYRFGLDAAKLEVETDGTIRAGKLRIPRPYAVDAKGVRRDAGMRLEGKELVVDLDTSELAYPIVLDPGVETASWTKIGSTTRFPRTDFAAGEVGGKFTMFGGTNGASLNDTWELSGATWTKKLPATSPEKRDSPYMAPLGGKLILFGGYDGSTAYNDTWSWDGTNWTKLSTPTAPPMRRVGVFSSFGSQIVLFGGQNTTGTTFGDTWVFNGTSWSQYLGAGPGARAFVSVGGRISTGVLVCNGNNGAGTSYGDSWLWNGTSWAKLPDPSGPPGLAFTDGTKAYGSSGGLYATVFDGSSNWAAPSTVLSGTEPLTRVLSAYTNRAYSRVFEGSTGYWAFTFGSGVGGTRVQRISAGVWSPVLADEGGAPIGVFSSQSGRPVVIAAEYGSARTWSWSGSTWSSTAPTIPLSFANAATESGTSQYLALTATVYRSTSGGPYASVVTGSSSSLTCPSGTANTLAVSDAGDIFYCDARASAGGWVKSGLSGLLVTFRGQVHALKSDGTLWKWSGSAFTQITSAGTVTGLEFLAASGNRLVGLRKGTSGNYDSASIFDGTSWRALTIPGGPSKVTAFVAAGARFYTYWQSGPSWGPAPVNPYMGTEMWGLDLGYDIGSTCTLSSDCTSGFCTDGVCCNVATCGAGSSCSTVTTKGSCRKIDGVACASATECGSAFCEGGTCCKTACATSTNTCSASGKAGTCLKLDGQPAASGAECGSGIAADGVCCNAACSGTCESCKAVDTGVAEGTCAPVVAGKDPASECPNPADVNSCGPDGLCDGKRACRVFAPDGKTCGSATCSTGEISGNICNGSGACVVAKKDCAPFQCASDAKSCLTTCATAADCKGTGLRCSAAGSCVALGANGVTCAAGAECASGNCVDGVCCNNACDGQCQACNVAGSAGTCSAIKGAPVGGRAACNGAGTPCAGSCDGVGAACTYPSFGTDCGTNCADGKFVEAKCDNKGACVTKDPLSCNNYACKETGCKESCATAADCAGPTFDCVGGKCIPQATARCADDGIHIVEGDKVTADCSPWTCKGGKCVTVCTDSALDCIAGHICGADGKCSPAAPPPGDEGGCVFSPRGSGAFGALLGLALLAGWRRRRSAS